MNSKIATTIAAVLAACMVPAAMAQKYPERPVRTIIAFPAGSATDIIGRVIVQKVSDIWGQQVVPDNRGGAGGSIASALAAKATPDGYTLLINSSAHAVNPSFYAKLPYDTQKDFIDISLLAIQPNVLIVPSNSPFKTTADFIKAAKAKPGSINFSFAGVGSGTHLNMVKFALEGGMKFNEVAYKGSSEAIIDVVGARVDTYLAPISAGLSFIQSGKVRALAVSTNKRSGLLPNVPTIAESGVPGFNFALWFGLWAPAGMPPAIVGKVAKDFTQALQDNAVSAKLGTLGNELNILEPAAFKKYVDQEIKDFAKIVKAAGIKPQ